MAVEMEAAAREEASAAVVWKMGNQKGLKWALTLAKGQLTIVGVCHDASCAVHRSAQ